MEIDNSEKQAASRPSFIGEGLIRSGRSKMMAHPLAYEDIIRSENVASLSEAVRDSVVIEIFRDARGKRERFDRNQRLQKLTTVK